MSYLVNLVQSTVVNHYITNVVYMIINQRDYLVQEGLHVPPDLLHDLIAAGRRTSSWFPIWVTSKGNLVQQGSSNHEVVNNLKAEDYTPGDRLELCMG